MLTTQTQIETMGNHRREGDLPELSPLEFIASNFDRLWTLCGRVNPNLQEELWDIVMDRTPRILERWDGRRDKWRWVVYNLRWYIFKYLKQRRRHEPLLDRGYTEDNRDDRIWVLELLEGLDDYHRDLLVERYVLGFTRQELADYHQVSVETIKKDVVRAIQWVRGNTT